jgi:hypothetical protein
MYSYCITAEDKFLQCSKLLTTVNILELLELNSCTTVHAAAVVLLLEDTMSYRRSLLVGQAGKHEQNQLQH